MRQRLDHRGFTLIEIVVAISIMLIIITITSVTIQTMMKHVSQQSKSAESTVEGVVGLEVLRSDLKHAGFGLPWSFQSQPAASAYEEAQVTSNSVPASGFWPLVHPPAPALYWVNSFNDAPGTPPRAIQSADTLFNRDTVPDSVTGVRQGSKYLVIKSMLVGDSPAAKKWANVAFGGDTRTMKVWGDQARDLSAGDQVVVVKNLLNRFPPTRQLMVGSTGRYATSFRDYSTMTQPHQDGDLFVVYGVDTSEPIMPFNRADYYVLAPGTGMPAGCAPHTGILYKSVLQHSDGSFAQMPILDCVADMQVVFGLDTSGGGFINSHTTVLSGTAQEIRDQLREIRVYLLVHQGKKDRGFSYPSRYVTVGERFGGTLQGREFDLQSLIGSSWQNYRWKVYTLVVRPKSLF